MRAPVVSRLPVTVVVPTRDRPEQLARCLESLQAAVGRDDEVIVVDSASRGASAVADVVARHAAQLIRCERPGVNIARNAGWRAGHHDLVLFADDDVVVDTGWAEALAAAVAAHPGIGFVTGRVLPPAGETPSRDVAIKRESSPEVYDATSVGNLGHGASIAVPRQVLERLGGWDEALGIGGRFHSAPEADLFDRCFAGALSGRYEPAALAWHGQWRGPRRLLALEARYGYGNGARLAKLVRTDRRRARLVCRDSLVGWGCAELWREAKAGHVYPALGVLIRMLATVAGFARAVAVPVVDGHFRTRTT